VSAPSISLDTILPFGPEPIMLLKSSPFDSASFLALGDILIFPVGHIVEFVTGAIYKPYPAKVEFNLQKDNK